MDSNNNTELFVGKVHRYFPRKQFGFIIRLTDKKQFFVHRTAIVTSPTANCNFPRLYPGEYVEFSVHDPPENILSNGDLTKKKLPNVGQVRGLYGWTLRCEDLSILRQLKNTQNTQNKQTQTPNVPAVPA